MTPIVVLGAGGHGRVVQELIRALGTFEIIGFLDQTAHAPHGDLVAPILGTDQLLPELRKSGLQHAFAAIGSNRVRELLGGKLRELEFIQPPLVHPSAFLAPSAKVQEGALVMARGIVGTNVLLKAHAILNTSAVIDHDGVLESASHVAPGCALAGDVVVGPRTLVGVGTSIRPGIRIGADVIVGAGSAVVDDIEDGACVGGAPARHLRTKNG